VLCSWFSWLVSARRWAVFQGGFIGGSLGFLVWLKDTYPTVNLARSEASHAKRDQFEQALGKNAVWDEMAGRKGTRVYVTSPFGDVEDVDQWPVMIDWLLDQHARLRRAIQAVRGLDRLTDQSRLPQPGDGVRG
jgi:hypothetical protein